MRASQTRKALSPMNLKIISFALALLAALAGCGSMSTHESALCHLVLVGFDEQDELAPAWYANAVAELKACGYDVAPDLADKRGRL